MESGINEVIFNILLKVFISGVCIVLLYLWYRHKCRGQCCYKKEAVNNTDVEAQWNHEGPFIISSNELDDGGCDSIVKEPPPPYSLFYPDPPPYSSVILIEYEKEECKEAN